MSTYPSRPLNRRGFLALGSGALLTLAGCASSDEPDSTTLGALPTVSPDKNTALRVGVSTTQAQLVAEPSLGPLPFSATWVRLNGGPETIQGFRAGAVDLAGNAGMPPIQAHDIGVDAKIVAISHNTAVNYIPTTRPGSGIRTAKDVVGKKIAFSQGQAQGVTILKWLKENGISYKDVTLVPLPSAQFLTALQGKQVDLAPLTEPSLTKYLKQYERDGARTLPTEVQDLLSLLWAPTSVLADDRKAAAIQAFIPIWVKGNNWSWENPEKWIDSYYVKDQGVTKDDGERIVKSRKKPLYPTDWDSSIAWEQSIADLMSGAGFVRKFDVSVLFDRRFEHIAAQAAPAEYRGQV
ncbi:MULTISPECIES: ABC transporter substrate-binding protein [Streptomyces]|uniref:ABC transporter substrate-binding protein n=1 Tax=Streptomyces viridochromogenes TaxID=1938 RepID=A0A0L8J019_STRVR|nr:MULTISPECIES: ABC transporter substrate-binding protein [Streptomyces]KOG07020.1 ABC transporter substrate-binding protein [Streptomyces viridochromogenes]